MGQNPKAFQRFDANKIGESEMQSAVAVQYKRDAVGWFVPEC